MRSELNELALIDNYLLHQLDAEETKDVETNMCVNAIFAEKVDTQRIAHRLIRLFSRKEERSRMEKIYQLLLTEKAFSDQIKALI